MSTALSVFEWPFLHAGHISAAGSLLEDEVSEVVKLIETRVLRDRG